MIVHLAKLVEAVLVVHALGVKMVAKEFVNHSLRSVSILTYSVAQSTLILEVAPMILCAHGATNNARAVERATLRMRLLSRRLSESFSVRSSVALF